MCLPELTWESLKGRYPAAARRKRALWRGRQNQQLHFSTSENFPESTEAEIHGLGLG